MTNEQLHEAVRKLILETFSLSEADAPAKLDVDSVEQWDSLGHLALIEAIEAGFKVSLAHGDAVNMLGEEMIVQILAEKLRA